MFLDTPLSPPNYNMFQSVTIETEIKNTPRSSTAMLNYFITEYPRLQNDINPFSFVYGLFENKNLTFADNQPAILNIATEIFSDTINLTNFEQSVLNATFNRLIKRKPTRPNRI